MRPRHRIARVALMLAVVWLGANEEVHADERNSPRFTLAVEKFWLLDSPFKDRFDASGLLFLPDGGLLTVNDRGSSLYRVQFRAGTNVADLL